MNLATAAKRGGKAAALSQTRYRTAAFPLETPRSCVKYAGAKYSSPDI